jgi:hypothetical protein
MDTIPKGRQQKMVDRMAMTNNSFGFIVVGLGGVCG